jgi:hypothetical protein
MSAWHFSKLENSSRLLAAYDRWKRTPYRKGSCAPGPAGGADCTAFIQGMLFASGAIPQFSFPRRPRDYSSHIYNEKILSYLRGQAHDPQSRALEAIFVELPRDIWPLMVGDLPVIKSGVELYHFLVAIDPPRCAQCAPPDGVSECDAGDPQYREKIVTIFRARSMPSIPRPFK